MKSAKLNQQRSTPKKGEIDEKKGENTPVKFEKIHFTRQGIKYNVKNSHVHKNIGDYLPASNSKKASRKKSESSDEDSYLNKEISEHKSLGRKRENRKQIPPSKKINNKNYNSEENHSEDEQSKYSDNHSNSESNSILSAINIPSKDQRKLIKFINDIPAEANLDTEDNSKNTLFSESSQDQKKNFSTYQKKIDTILNTISKKIQNDQEYVLDSTQKFNPNELFCDRIINLSPSKKEQLIHNRDYDPIQHFSLDFVVFPPDFQMVVNLKETLMKPTILKSDLALSMIEIVKNHRIYQLESVAIFSKYFWETVVRIEQFQKIFGKNATRLRVYWNHLKHVIHEKDLIKSLVESYGFINSSPINTLNFFKLIEEYCTCFTGTDRNRFINFFTEKLSYMISSRGSDEGKDDTIPIMEEGNFLKNDEKLIEPPKTWSSNPGINLMTLQEKLFRIREVEILPNDFATKRSYFPETIRLCSEFPKYSMDFIEECLKSCSRRVEEAKRFLENPEKHYLKFGFSKLDDYVILNNKGSELYEIIANHKGKEQTLIREGFLLHSTN